MCVNAELVGEQLLRICLASHVETQHMNLIVSANNVSANRREPQQA